MTARVDRYTTYVVLDRVLAARALPDALDPLPGLPQEDATSSRASRCRRRSASQTFIDAWDEGDFAQGMWGSFLVATTVTAVSAVLSLLTGYAFGTMRFRGSGAALQPDRGRADLPLRGDGHPALLRLPQLPPGRHRPRGLVLGADPAADRAVGHARARSGCARSSSARRSALVEAGRIDGAGSFRILRSILLPQARPALLTLCVLVFIYTWNEFLLALVLLAGSDNTTAPLGLSFFAGVARAGDPTKVAAASVLVAAADRDRLPGAAAPLHPRRAGGRDQGVSRGSASRSASTTTSPVACCSQEAGTSRRSAAARASGAGSRACARRRRRAGSRAPRASSPGRRSAPRAARRPRRPSSARCCGCSRASAARGAWARRARSAAR